MLNVWPNVSLKALLKQVIDYRGKAPPKSDDGVQLITARNVRRGSLDLSYREYILDCEFEAWMNRGLPEAGDILFTTEAPLGHACMYPADGRYALGQRIVTLRANPEKCDPGYLLQFLLSDGGQEAILLRATGSTAMGIKSSELQMISVPCPPLSDQRKIAEVLRTWDEAIEKLEALRAAQSSRATGAAQILLAPSRAIGKHIPRTNWVTTLFAEAFEERQDRNDDLGPDDVVTVGKYAIRKQSEHFTRSVASSDLSNYRVISPGDFVYDPMSAYYGAIGRYQGTQDGIVSPAYRVIRLRTDIAPEFMVALLRSYPIRFQLDRKSSQGNKEGKRRIIQRDEFGSIEFNLPALDIQRHIAAVLADFERDIALVTGQLDALRRQKRGLMQKLLTGQWRVSA